MQRLFLHNFEWNEFQKEINDNVEVEKQQISTGTKVWKIMNILIPSLWACPASFTSFQRQNSKTIQEIWTSWKYHHDNPHLELFFQVHAVLWLQKSVSEEGNYGRQQQQQI